MILLIILLSVYVKYHFKLAIMFPKGLARRLVLHSLPCHEYESAWTDIFKGGMRWIFFFFYVFVEVAQKICIKRLFSTLIMILCLK